VEDCDKSGGAVKRALIPECPSQPGELKHLSTRRKGKKNSTPSVAASERGRAQTGGETRRGCRTTFRTRGHSGTARNRRRHRVKAPYATGPEVEWDPEYDSTRGSESESAGTIPQG